MIDVSQAQTLQNTTMMAQQQFNVSKYLVGYRVMEDIEENYASRDTVADYCERLGVTERTLRRATTACLQLSPIAMVHKRKCLEAQRLLRFTPLSISAIAHTLGFTDPSYFSRRFKQLTGKVPRDIRP